MALNGKSRTMRNFAVFGDVHGHLRLMFQLCRLWQKAHGQKLEAIFQCGDLGYLPDPTHLDKATINYVKNDPEELGFQYFTRPVPLLADEKLKEMLCGDENSLDTVSCPVYFCHGNHEDFQSLRAEVGIASMRSVDCFDRIHWIKPGHVVNLDGIRIAAVGGGTEPPDDDLGKEPWKWVDVRACERLMAREFDVLISHTSPQGIGGESDLWGSQWLRDMVEISQPDYHFFAHHQNPVPYSAIGQTMCYWLNDVNFEKQRKGLNWPLVKDCMGILSWGGSSEHEFHVIDEDWMKKVTFMSWWKM